ncbi:MAG: DUF2817 domain-containing protein [Flavobacteriaceae bacterium]|nr:DUF2817 domain-containing protein [Flavobacteriaceae bacterium]
MTLKQLEEFFEKCKVNHLHGRYINLDHISPLIDQLSSSLSIKIEGYSVNNNPIHSIQWGNGKTRILIWSQMHGNESTTTKAIFDLFQALQQHMFSEEFKGVQLMILPMLNPDGAQMYTRQNANDIDLNRDAKDISQPESRILRKAFDAFKPHYCFNMHGQRTLYSAGPAPNSAVLSFLAPAADPERTVNQSRKQSMAVIAEMKKQLTPLIPGQIALYNDAFNINCVGDTFQSHSTPSILFEAGHFPKDYNREVVRRLIFKAMAIAISFISNSPHSTYDYEHYTEIPQNEERFYDILIRNTSDADIGIRYKEILKDGKIEFIPEVTDMGILDNKYGHKEINADQYSVLSLKKEPFKPGDEIDIVLINNEKFSLKLTDS